MRPATPCVSLLGVARISADRRLLESFEFFEFAMRVEVHGKLTADAVLIDEGLKHFPWQADCLAVISDHPHPIVLRGIKSARLVLTDGQTEDRERHGTSLSAATAKSAN
jgi:hypothetical protein